MKKVKKTNKKKINKNKLITGLVDNNYHQMYIQMKKLHKSKTRNEIDEVFGLSDINDDKTRILVMSAMISSGQADDYENQKDSKSCKIMRKVADKFLDDLFYKTTDENDGKALNKLGIYNQVAISDFFTNLLKENSSYCTDIIESAINAGADLNITNCEGQTILANALKNRQFDIAELLLDNGYDINLTDDKGRTSLFYLNDGDIDIAEWLIGNGIDINLTDSMRNTALFLVMYSDLEIARLLINAGADLNIRNSDGDNVLTFHRINFGPGKYHVDECHLIPILNLLVSSKTKFTFNKWNVNALIDQALEFKYDGYINELISSGLFQSMDFNNNREK
jgi:ankyrin repeat protein